ncbi:hypothetical protein COT51_00680 [candidate division WWE3 bacterium CG08_land_8_20_14_0_20_41_15]|uniref:Uncharacterized protein n=1 Tax=candidate division WWE3 bacterium CG08_land_8_20_14_0_20_41_15 TaxID=1975086 RepID=A0A2H0XCC5_UNCKA|nr:MAG: hypothetical protein COT51_00680 [candidate division WWE3 bacterium CG08_land_8_20_14_0_20_41_15]
MTINEKVSVETTCDEKTKALTPTKIVWRNRDYPVEKIGMHHTLRRGRELIHVFSLIANGNFFQLEFGTEGLVWVLTQMDS